MKHLTCASIMVVLSSTACAPVDGDDALGSDLSEITSGTHESAQAAGYVRVQVSGAWTCTGIVVHPNWVLTTRCINPDTQPSWVRVAMSTGSADAGVPVPAPAPAVEIVRHPTESIALLRVTSPMPFPRTLGSATGAALTGAELRCHGFSSGTFIQRSGNFIAQAPTGALHALRDARRLPNAINVGDGDVGGPCELASGPATGQVVAMLQFSKPSCTSPALCAIDGTAIRVDGFREWVADMIRLSPLRTQRPFYLENLTNNQCWSIADGRLDHGAPVTQFPCNFTSNQAYYTGPVPGITTHVTIVNARSGKCVEVTAGTSGDGALLRQATCTGANNQLWQAVPSGVGQFTFRPRSEPTRCVDIPNGTWAPAGTRLQLGGCHGGPNQQWRQSF